MSENDDKLDISDKKNPENQGLHDNHRERLRRRYMKEGFEHFQEHEIIELLLFYGIPRKNTNEIAHRMLNKYKTLYEVFNAGAKELQEYFKIPEQAAVLISMQSQLYRRYLESNFPEKTIIDTSDKAGEYAISLLLGYKIEKFYVAYLNKKLGLIDKACFGSGSVKEVTVNMRNIVKSAIEHNAHNVLIFHNHPSGLLSPSKSDLDTTVLIRNVLESIDVKLLDHIIVGKGEFYSFSQKRLMGFNF